MKIAMIGQKRIPSREGGIEVVVTELSTRMVSNGQHVDCYNRWVPSVNGKLPAKDVYQGINLYRVRTFQKSGLNAIVYAVRATLHAVLRKYDVIHLHAIGPASMVWLPHLLHIPTVVTVHGLDWQRAKWGGFATAFLRFGEKMAAKYADEIIVLTETAEKYFLATYGRECKVVRNGISPIDKYAPDEVRERWALEKGEYILFLARLVPEKGIHYLIEAFRRTNTTKRLVIAGALEPSTEYIEQLQEMAKGDNRIIFTDFVDANLVYVLLQHAYMYVLPSDVEGLALSLLEALYCGVPCLLSDIPENVEAAGEFGYYFEKGNPDSLYQQMNYMLEHPATDEENQRRSEFVAKRYNWDTITEQTLDVYREAILKYKNEPSTQKQLQI